MPFPLSTFLSSLFGRGRGLRPSKKRSKHQKQNTNNSNNNNTDISLDDIKPQHLRVTIDSIPNELLLKIFEELPYFDLKLRVPLASKRFRSLVDAKSRFGVLDGVLFRDCPAPVRGREDTDKKKEEEEELTFTAHPAFAMLDYKWTQTFDEIAFDPTASSSKHTVKLSKTKVMNENAVSPLTGSLYIGIPIGCQHRSWMILITLTKPSAVTVGDVMKTLSDTLTADLSYDLPWIQTSIYRSMRMPIPPMESMIRNAVGKTWGKLLVRQDGGEWKGFHTVSVDHNGDVYMQAGYQVDWRRGFHYVVSVFHSVASTES